LFKFSKLVNPWMSQLMFFKLAPSGGLEKFESINMLLLKLGKNTYPKLTTKKAIFQKRA